MKNYLITVSIMCFILLFSSSLSAKIELHEFDSPQQQKLYKTLSEQLRCLVCQNQNLADSNAELAQDMRQKTFQMVKQNKSKTQIVDYWVTRYGDFVLYNPPFKRSTLILWIGPFLLLLVALYFAKKIVENGKNDSQPTADQLTKTKNDHQAVQKLLTNNTNNK